jgi:hypothetical protein
MASAVSARRMAVRVAGAPRISSCAACSGGRMRALPKITMVDSMPSSCCTSSGLSSSSCMRTGRSSSRSRKSVSVKARR